MLFQFLIWISLSATIFATTFNITHVNLECSEMNSVPEMATLMTMTENLRQAYMVSINKCNTLLTEAPTLTINSQTAAIAYYYCSSYNLNLNTDISNLSSALQTQISVSRDLCISSMKIFCNDENNKISDIQTLCEYNRINACLINNLMDKLNNTLIFCDDDVDDDGVNNNDDAFPRDPKEWKDSDGDGIGDNADPFPNDSSETTDSDGDGVGDNADVFPDDASEWKDTNNNGIGDNADVFPEDTNATVSAVYQASELLLRTVFNEKYACN